MAKPLTSLSVHRSLFALFVAGLSACGGSTASEANGIAATGGAFQVNTGGSSQRDEVGGACGFHIAVCDQGDQSYVGDVCPSGFTCYSRSVGCESMTINCAHPIGDTGGTSTGGDSGFGGGGGFGNVGNAAGSGAVGANGGAGAVGNSPGIGGSGAVGNVGNTGKTGVGGSNCSAPSCAAGYFPNGSQCASSNTACYTISFCAGAILACVSADPICDRGSDYNRSYVQADTTRCQSIAIDCISGTQSFSNSCGCGCEQPASCPRSVDCMPGSAAPDPLCVDSTTCPLSPRAL